MTADPVLNETVGSAVVAKGLLGRWRLERMTTTRDSVASAPLGAEPSGRLSYGRDGTMSVELCKDHGAGDGGSMPDVTTYQGRFTLDHATDTVTHHIEAASIPQLVGTDQVRHFSLSGDQLILAAASSGGKTVLEWSRDQVGREE